MITINFIFQKCSAESSNKATKLVQKLASVLTKYDENSSTISRDTEKMIAECENEILMEFEEKDQFEMTYVQLNDPSDQIPHSSLACVEQAMLSRKEAAGILKNKAQSLKTTELLDSFKEISCWLNAFGKSIENKIDQNATSIKEKIDQMNKNQQTENELLKKNLNQLVKLIEVTIV